MHNHTLASHILISPLGWHVNRPAVCDNGAHHTLPHINIFRLNVTNSPTARQYDLLVHTVEGRSSQALLRWIGLAGYSQRTAETSPNTHQTRGFNGQIRQSARISPSQVPGWQRPISAKMKGRLRQKTTLQHISYKTRIQYHPSRCTLRRMMAIVAGTAGEFWFYHVFRLPSHNRVLPRLLQNSSFAVGPIGGRIRGVRRCFRG